MERSGSISPDRTFVASHKGADRRRSRSLEQLLGGPTGRLCLLGSTAAVVYLLGFTARFPLLRYYLWRTDLAGLTNESVAGAAAYVAEILALFAIYGCALKTAREVEYERGRLVVYFFALAFGLAGFFLYPITATDMYSYLVLAREWVHYGANPLTTPPDAFPRDPLNYYVGQWSYRPSPYGPLWTFLTAVPGLLAGRSLLAGLLSLKVLGLAAYLGCSALISQVLGKLQPEARLMGVVIFAWNPVAVLEIVGNCHNDGVMMWLFLASLALVLSRWRVLSVAALALSVLTKYPSALLAPVVYLLLLRGGGDWKQRRRTAIAATLLAAATTVALFAPLWAGEETIAEVVRQQGVFCYSPGLALLYGAESVIPERAYELTRALLAGVFGLLYLSQVIRVCKTPDSWPEASFEVTFGLMFTLTCFNAWYLVWPLTFAAISQRGLIPWRMLALSLTVSLGVFLYGFADAWLQWDFRRFLSLAVMVIFLPPAVLSLMEAFAGKGSTDVSTDG